MEMLVYMLVEMLVYVVFGNAVVDADGDADLYAGRNGGFGLDALVSSTSVIYYQAVSPDSVLLILLNKDQFSYLKKYRHYIDI